MRWMIVCMGKGEEGRMKKWRGGLVGFHRRVSWVVDGYLGWVSRQARQPAAVCLMTQRDTRAHCCCDWCRRSKHMAAFVSEVPAVRLTGVAGAMGWMDRTMHRGIGSTRSFLSRKRAKCVIRVKLAP